MLWNGAVNQNKNINIMSEGLDALKISLLKNWLQERMLSLTVDIIKITKESNSSLKAVEAANKMSEEVFNKLLEFENGSKTN